MFGDEWNAASVARHKNDQIDKLMRLGAPRERLAHGALVLFVLATAAVAALGSVNRSLSLEGELHRTGVGGSWRASLPAAPAIARKVEPGLKVRIEVLAPSGEVLVLPGEVIVPEPAPSAGAPPLPDADARRIAVAADISAVPAGLFDTALPDGSPCRVTMALGRQSILRALLSA